MFQSKATKQKKLVAALQGNAEASAIHRIHSTDSCLFVYLSITFTFVSSSLFIFLLFLFHSFFSKGNGNVWYCHSRVQGDMVGHADANRKGSSPPRCTKYVAYSMHFLAFF